MRGARTVTPRCGHEGTAGPVGGGVVVPGVMGGGAGTGYWVQVPGTVGQASLTVGQASLTVGQASLTMGTRPH